MTDMTRGSYLEAVDPDRAAARDDDKLGLAGIFYHGVDGLSADSLGIEVSVSRFDFDEIGTSIVGSLASPTTVCWELKGSFWANRHVSRHSRDSLFQDLIMGLLKPAIISRDTGTSVEAPALGVPQGRRSGRLGVPSSERPGARRPEKSPWADAIGPLYTVEAAAVETGMTVTGVQDAIDARALLAIESAEGQRLLPVVQFDMEGRPVPGLRWILSRLGADMMDPYMVAAWLNRAREELDDLSPWGVLKSGSGLTPELKELVESLRTRFAQ